MDIPLIERVKIQAQVLVPLIKALRSELGEQRADALVQRTLGELYRAYGDKWWRSQGSPDLGQTMAKAFRGYAAGDAMNYEVVQQTPGAFEVHVTTCRYAQFYQRIGVPELGFLLTCSADFPMAEGYGAGVHLTRTQTLMQGAPYCDFKYTLKNAQGAGD
jgi:hypothetical protein